MSNGTKNKEHSEGCGSHDRKPAWGNISPDSAVNTSPVLRAERRAAAGVPERPNPHQGRVMPHLPRDTSPPGVPQSPGAHIRLCS
ncbi:hypothetical protein DPEC_G00182380 [Dallia pectoralis]|uniref:Uncharacterized protein n=1 Tax=Dallia pectoralis TaxID=75939 RepID=A0ACC2GAH7_DALPE|nr:hypothetical protein DPEC_G00182380 [Dallia pectoralis]